MKQMLMAIVTAALLIVTGDQVLAQNRARGTQVQAGMSGQQMQDGHSAHSENSRQRGPQGRNAQAGAAMFQSRGQANQGMVPSSQQPDAGGTPGQAYMQWLFAQLDQNGDGVLTANEVPQRGRQQLAQMDTNGDGGCDRAEMESAIQNMERRGQPQGQRQQNGPRGGQQARVSNAFAGGQSFGGSFGQATGGQTQRGRGRVANASRNTQARSGGARNSGARGRGGRNR